MWVAMLAPGILIPAPLWPYGLWATMWYYGLERGACKVERLRVGILRGDGPDDRYLEGVLCDNFEVPLVVVEPREVRLRRLAHQRKYRDLAYSRYNAWRSKI